MTDFSAAEKDKIWQAACDANGEYQELNFEQFKALIIGEGGFHLKAKVEGMAATAQASQIENEPLGHELVELTHGIPSNVSIAQLATAQKSTSLKPPSDVSDWERGANSCASGMAAMGKEDGSLTPEQSTSPHTLPVLKHHANTMQPLSDFNVDPPNSDSGSRRFVRVRSSHSGRLGHYTLPGEALDKEDDCDENGNLQPKLLTKRNTSQHGGTSPDLVRSVSEGGGLKSPHGAHRRAAYAFATMNTPPATPNDLPNKSKHSPTAAGRGSNNFVSFRDNRNGASPDSVAEHGFTIGLDASESSHHSGTAASQTDTLVSLQHPCDSSLV